MPSLAPIATLAAAVLLIALAPSRAGAEWQQSQFDFAGKPVIDFHCAPAGAGAHPVVILLHGAGYRGSGYDDYQQACADLAPQGYYVDFIEYFSQTPAVLPGQNAEMAKDFPTWVGEISAGIAALAGNPAVDPKRIALMGFSLGSFLSLATATANHDKIAAIVEYYGGLPPGLKSQVKYLPPILILHGDADQLVPVAQASDLDAMLTKEDRPHEMNIYPGANHAFNFPDAGPWYDAAAASDARERSLKFLAQYLKPASAS